MTGEDPFEEWFIDHFGPRPTATQIEQLQLAVDDLKDNLAEAQAALSVAKWWGRRRDLALKAWTASKGKL